jgi:hypothetical protein
MVLIEGSYLLHTVVPMIVAGQCIGLTVAIAHHDRMHKKWVRYQKDFRYPWEDVDELTTPFTPSKPLEQADEAETPSISLEQDNETETAAISDGAEAFYEYMANNLWCGDDECGGTGGSPSHQKLSDTGGDYTRKQSHSARTPCGKRVSPCKPSCIELENDSSVDSDISSQEENTSVKCQGKQRQLEWVNSRTYSLAGVETTLFWADGDAMMPAVHLQVR